MKKSLLILLSLLPNLCWGASLTDDCCSFPLKRAPKAAYAGKNAGQRAFGYRRDDGARLHAAADLYQAQYEPVYAIADGTLIQDRKAFYLGTNATIIDHGGFTVRYGEMASNSLKPLTLRKEITKGQLIGYIKKVNSRKVTSAMLHFELFSGKADGGALSVAVTRKNKFGRRTDLMNPTSYLLAWEKN